MHLRTAPALIFLLLLVLLAGTRNVQAAPRGSIEERRESFTSGGRNIRVDTFAPRAPGRYPAVLVLHSAAGMLAGKRELVDFSRQLAAQGHVAFLVHYFHRTGTLIAGDRAIAELPPVWIETVRHAVDFAAAHPKVNSGAIGIFGFSLGAYLAVAESSLDPRVDAIVEVAGGIFEGFEPRMRRVPQMLILHGRADERVPVARAYELQKAARRLGVTPRLKIYEGEGHRLSQAASQDAAQRALAFFHEHLKR
jgi:carboxymethylenebutenolidase